jgi:dihydrofolate reductase
VGKVIADQSMSLDGFSAGPNVRISNGMGDGGEALHEWMSRESGRTGRGGEVLQDVFEGTGAVVVGRGMFDVGEEPWGDDPPFHRPVFVVTHRPKAPVVKQGGTTYMFVTDGLDATLARAREAAGDQDISIAGGASTVRQYLAAGLIDELRLHIAPVTVGAGERLLDDVGDLKLEPIEAWGTGLVTHISYKVHPVAS